MRTIDNEEVTFESIDDHFYKFDTPEVLEPELEPVDPAHSLATAFTLARPILLAMIAPPDPRALAGGHRHPRLRAGRRGGGCEGFSGGVGGGSLGLLRDEERRREAAGNHRAAEPGPAKRAPGLSLPSPVRYRCGSLSLALINFTLSLTASSDAKERSDPLHLSCLLVRLLGGAAHRYFSCLERVSVSASHRR
jgi:hypothetical protein